MDTEQGHRAVPPSCATKQCHQAVCLAAGEDATDEAAGSYAIAKGEAAVRRLARLAAGEDAADEGAGSNAKAKEEAAVRR